jgi:hypothetical protein
VSQELARETDGISVGPSQAHRHQN